MRTRDQITRRAQRYYWHRIASGYTECPSCHRPVSLDTNLAMSRHGIVRCHACVSIRIAKQLKGH